MKLYKYIPTLLILYPVFSFSQDDDLKLYQHIEPQIKIGTLQWIKGGISYNKINLPIYEIGISYHLNLDEKFILYPYLAYSKERINNTGTFVFKIDKSIETFNSLIIGGSIIYKIQNWYFGVGIYGKNFTSIIEHFSNLTYSNEYNQTNEFLNKIYYIGNMNISYSFSNFRIIAEARYCPIGIQQINPFGGNNIGIPIYFIDYLLGVSYHL